MISIPNLTLAYLLLEWAIRLIMVVVIPVRRPPEAARSWLLLVLFLPVPAFILYRLIGRAAFPSWRRDRFRRAAPERESAGQALMSSKSAPSRTAVLAQWLGGFPNCGGNALHLLEDYDGTIDAMVTAIDAAHVRVHLLTYIFADDRTGQKVADALGRAHARGVDVRVLIDALGSRPWAKRSLPMLADRGVTARLVLPVRFAALRRARSDLRNHRKLCLIDGRVAEYCEPRFQARDRK